MIIEKKTFGEISMPYSMLRFTVDSINYAISASEARDGEILLVDLDHNLVKKVAGLAGGIMSIVKVPGKRNLFFAIQKFYPVFQSEEAEVVCFALEDLDEASCRAEILSHISLPFVHRISIDRMGGKLRLIGATLCRSKAYTEDWSTPGYVCSYEIDDTMNASEPQMLIPEITKNHGMYTDENGIIYISGEEGIWKIDHESNVTKVTDVPVGDLCLYDVDGDGEKEILCISPFHGNSVKILKNDENGWRIDAETPIAFGHAIWCGPCGEETGVLVCERGDEKKIRRYRVADDGTLDEREVIDAGTGTTNFDVTVAERGLLILAANHARGEIAQYQAQF